MTKLLRRAMLVVLCSVSVFSASRTTAATDPILERRVIGTSLQGRPLEAYRLGAKGGVVVVVIGVIHGDEDAGLQITNELVKMSAPRGVELWVVPTMNPDGTALDQRGNANLVDLNRNFPYAWAKMGKPGYWQFSGPKRASEPETKAIVRFMRQIKPELGIWYHQDLNMISPGKGFEGALRTKYSQLTGIPIKRITGGTYTGVAATWQRSKFAGSGAFVVELGSSLSNDSALVHAQAVHIVAMMVRDR
ncbi:MAG: M14 family metallopeptidase [Ilumatobacteraceae bacterium]